MRSQDDVMWMATNGFEFRDVEKKCPRFRDEPHNVKLFSIVDGVNPFVDMRYFYLVWLVFVLNNIIPPWMSIKRSMQCCH
jgi:hypothetical protein